MKRVWLLASLACAACRDSPRHATGDWEDPPECQDDASAFEYCIQPGLRLVTAFERDGSPSILVSGGDGHTADLTFADGSLVQRDVLELGSTSFNDLDRLLSCDVDRDGKSDLVFSPIDALTRAAIVWADPRSHPDAVQRIDAVERLQGARCLDVDDDGHADLFGMLDQDHFGMLRGDDSGFRPAAIAVEAELSDENVALSTTAVIREPDQLIVAKIRYQQPHLDVWRVGITTGVATYEGTRELAGQEAWLIDSSRIDDSETPSVVVTGPRSDGGAGILVLPGDSSSLLGADPLVLMRDERPLHVHDVDADSDGDVELLVAGQHDGAYLIDIVDGELQVVDELAPAPVVDAALLDLDLDGSLDLAMIRADLDKLEVVLGAVAPEAMRQPGG